MSSKGLTGAITYSINEASLAALPSDAARQDFRNRIADATANWSQTAGISITQAPTGQAGRVTVDISTDPQRDLDDGVVYTDPNDTTRRIVSFSDEWITWAPESKDRIVSHEFGHVLGLKDIPPGGGCPNLETIMRQTGATEASNIIADMQLQNGFTGCSQPGNEFWCSHHLPQPARPTSCDTAAAKKSNSTKGTRGTLTPTPTPTPVASPPPTGGGGGPTYCDMFPGYFCNGGGGTGGYGGGGYESCDGVYRQDPWTTCAGGSCETHYDYVLVGYYCSYSF